MHTLVFTLMLFIFTPCCAADAEKKFVYNDHGKQDPFSPLVTAGGAVVSYDSDLSLAELNLEGIVQDPKGESAAIINGKIVKMAQQIGPYQVEAISGDHVVLVKDGERFTLQIKRGGR